MVVGPQDYWDAPEVLQTSSPDIANSRDKYPSPGSLDNTSPASDRPRLLPFSSDPEPPRQRNRTIWGFKRRTFLVAAGLVVLLFAAALVGAVVGVWASNKSKTDAEPWPTVVPTPNIPLNPSLRNLAASRSAASTGEDIQIFYNDLASTDVLYRLRWNGDSRPEQAVTLHLEPSPGTPLAVVSSGTNPVTVYLFYITARSADSAGIAQAVLTCAGGGAGCSTVSNELISANVTNGVDPDTGLAAVLLDGRSSIRVYYEAQFHHIWELNSDTANAAGWGGQHIAGPILSGAGIAAYVDNSSAVNIFSVANKTLTMRVFTYLPGRTADGGESLLPDQRAVKVY